VTTHADGRQPADGTEGPVHPTAWWSRRAVGLHVTLAVVLPLFAGLFWWQVQRVRQGNTLSWAYVFEWPFFAAYAVYLWWHLVHEQPEPAGVGTDLGASPPVETGAHGADKPDGHRVPVTEVGGDEDERELAAYNRYLAELDASGRRKHW